MKTYILLCLMFFAFVLPVRGNTTNDSTIGLIYRLTVEIISTNRFYDISSIGQVYKKANPGLSNGLMINWNLPRKFYLAIGGFYTQSAFNWDTTGRFPPGATFLAPLVLKKEFAYLDKVLLVGKRVEFKKWSAGFSAGFGLGTLVKGKSYIQGGYAIPIPWISNNDPQFNRKVNSMIFGGDVSYSISPRISVLAKTFFRRYNYIDEYEAFLNYGSINENKRFYHNLWNFGVGIQYNFLDREKTKNWFKKKK